MRTSAIGHHFGDEGDADGKFAAHPQPSQKAIKDEVPNADGKRAEPGAKRVDQNGNEHRFRTSCADQHFLCLPDTEPVFIVGIDAKILKRSAGDFFDVRAVITAEAPVRGPKAWSPG